MIRQRNLQWKNNKSSPESEQEVFQPLDQRLFNIRLGIFVFKVQELPHVRIFYRIVRRDGILGLYYCRIGRPRFGSLASLKTQGFPRPIGQMTRNRML